MRKLSITMFTIIGLLLGSKLGLQLWQLPSSAALGTNHTSINSTSINTTSVSSINTDDMMIPIKNDVIEPEATPTTLVPSTATSTDSLAIIASYLIPNASAATSPRTGLQGSIIEDETLSTLRKLKNDMDQRSKNLDQREQHLQQAEKTLQQRITELEQLEASIQQRLSDESKIKSKKIKRLTAVYEGMKPDRSAPVIARMELATVVKIFLLMDEKKVGKILSFLPPEKAVIISQALTKQISTVK